MLVLHSPCSQGYLMLSVTCLGPEMILRPNPTIEERCRILDPYALLQVQWPEMYLSLEVEEEEV